MLHFKQCSFAAKDIKSISAKTENSVYGEGAKFTFNIELENGSSFSIDPSSVIEPENSQEIYYRDKDPSWATLHDIYYIIEDGYCRWYHNDDAKEFARKFNYHFNAWRGEL